MADTTRSRDWRFAINAVAAAFKKDSISVSGDQAVIDRLRSGNSLYDENHQVVSKRPMIEATLYDPSLVTTWAALTGVGVTATFRLYAQNGGPTGAYDDFTLATGAIHPVSLTASQKTAAELQVRVLGSFTAGVGFAVATTGGAAAALVVAYYPKSLTVGGSPVANLIDINLSWDYQAKDEEALEPTYYYYDDASQSGTATITNLNEATVARLEDGAEETLVAVFEDLDGAGADVSVDLGTVKLFAQVTGDTAQLSFDKLQV